MVRGPGYAAFNLEVPIQVVYKAAGQERVSDHQRACAEVIDGNGTSQAHSEDSCYWTGPDIELPMYVR